MSVPTQALRQTLLELVRIESPIGEERALADQVERRLHASLGDAAVTRFEDNLVVRPRVREGLPRIGLAGHLDTVRTHHEGVARIEGERLFGAGASDMKAGLAIMLELTERLDLDALPCELTLVFYAREEGPYEENMLGPVLDRFAHLRELDLAVCLEPSDNRMQVGCMGSVHALAHFSGRTAHSARPWQGENALFKAAEFIQTLAAREPHVVNLFGHEYREVITPTLIHGGRARNIVPDEVEVNVNYRFAPGRTPLKVAEELRELLGDLGRLEPTDLAPAGHPHTDHPLVRRLAECGVVAVERKQAWTDVARFDAAGVAAVNLGPGNGAQAHQRNEYVDLPLVDEGYGIFERFLTGLSDFAG
ncbi:MAG: succinyl-diaminopimelate desuccinylase [Deltaproteobacteria bacterium]|nr:succinyl-diaminopimelate desuccinylase [Deltaproteobacteria bacterium]